MDVAFLEAAGLTVAVVVVFTVLLRLAQRLWRRGRSSPDDVENGAHRLYFAGQLIGILWLTTSIVHGVVSDDESLGHDAAWSFAFAATGFALYLVAGQLGVRVLLGRHLADEIDSGNVAAALAGAGHHIAMAILVAAACSGTDLFGWSLASGFFVLGVLAQQIVAALFRALTPYDDAEQIAGENMAAALSWTGTSIAAAIVIARAVEGDADTFVDALVGFGQVSCLALLLLPIRQLMEGGL
jgi:uncharacterized membrane protein YjfL (UPF0719 family)